MTKKDFYDFFKNLNAYNESYDRKIKVGQDKAQAFVDKCTEIENEGFKFDSFEIKNISMYPPKYPSRIFESILGVDLCVIKFTNGEQNKFCIIDPDGEIINASPSKLNYYSEEIIRKKDNYKNYKEIADIAKEINVKPIDLFKLYNGIKPKEMHTFAEFICEIEGAVYSLSKAYPNFGLDNRLKSKDKVEREAARNDFFNAINATSKVLDIDIPEDRSDIARSAERTLRKLLRKTAIDMYKRGAYVPTLKEIENFKIGKEILPDAADNLVSMRNILSDWKRQNNRWERKLYPDEIIENILMKLAQEKQVVLEHITSQLPTILQTGRFLHPEVKSNRIFAEAINDFISNENITISDFKKAICQPDFVKEFKKTNSLEKTIENLKPFKTTYKQARKLRDELLDIKNDIKEIDEKKDIIAEQLNSIKVDEVEKEINKDATLDDILNEKKEETMSQIKEMEEKGEISSKKEDTVL